ncbi:helicase-related protein [Candidatus Stoquefichus massiliensis]|uniref:helicase-related protein n=1 Tax=Candidatus Stoquefichus massiliensis TaxID=1470350 RepID=UPI0004872A55|nr:helicase-related protein [Candidatus Stoquefichus massiliensis]
MQCPRCHNQNVKQLYKLNGQYYCRQCIQFHQVFIHESRQTTQTKYPPPKVSYTLSFELSEMQKKISQQLVNNYQHHLNSLVLAVCGSGKTEIVFELIQYALQQGDRVCFCIPRKELVKELYERISEAFHGIEIGLLYGGHIENQDAPFIICTMHQLYRFENNIGFQLMIADEVDAFPFYQNHVLQEIFQHCCQGNYVKLSATFSIEDIHDEEMLVMNRRYHGYDLPVPRMIIGPQWLHKLTLIFIIQYLQKKIIVFVPSIHDVEVLTTYLARHHIRTLGVSSKHTQNQKVIQALKDQQIDVIVSTTLLERGITIEDVQVIVYHGEHALFDERTLIQIAGRVGRKPHHPIGKVYIITSTRTQGISKCIQTIKRLNMMNV